MRNGKWEMGAIFKKSRVGRRGARQIGWPERISGAKERLREGPAGYLKNRMAGKEAIQVLIDVSQTMEQPFSEERTRLSVAAQAAKMLIQQKLQFHKSHEVGVGLFGVSDGSDEEGGVAWLQHLGRCELDTLREIEGGAIAPHTDGAGDWVDAMQTAIDEMVERIGTKKYKKRLFLLTDGESRVNAAGLRKLENSLLANEVRLNAITIGFGDEDDEMSEEQQRNLELLTDLTKNVDGRIFPGSVAIEIYQQLQRRSVYPVAKYRGWFQLSERAKMAVRVYGKTREEKLPSIKKYSLAVEHSDDISQAKVKMERTYALTDDPDENPVDERVRGYYYGKQFVPVAEEDANELLKYRCEKSLKLLGFAPRTQVPHHLYLAGVEVVMPVEECQGSGQAFGALVEATKQKDTVAICRFVYQNNRAPKLVVLTPVVKENARYFYMNYLPTLEDIRDYQFKSLAPATTKQLDATASFVKSLDLLADDDELLRVKQTFNPVLQHFTDCLNHRACHQEGLPEVNPEISAYLRPDRTMFQGATKACRAFASAFTLKEVEPSEAKKPRVCWKELLAAGLERPVATGKQVDVPAGKEKLGGDIPIDLNRGKISSVSPVEDFDRMLSDKHEDLVEKAMEQMQEVIDTFIQGSVMGDLHEKAKTCVVAMRAGAVREDEAPTFNNYLRGLAARSDRNTRDFVNYLRTEGIKLIDKTESTSSGVLPGDSRLAMADVQMAGVEDDDMLDLIE